MKTTWNAGPWTHKNGGIWAKDGALVAAVAKDEGIATDANARLIAAAPQLYHAARTALQFFDMTRVGEEWTAQGGTEAEGLRKALDAADGGLWLS